MLKTLRAATSLCFFAFASIGASHAQIPELHFFYEKAPQPVEDFSWSNTPQNSHIDSPISAKIQHKKFHCKENRRDIGYLLYEPDLDYQQAPVIYVLGDSAVGNEYSGLKQAQTLVEAIELKLLPPMYVVSLNGGPKAYYDADKKAQGESAALSLISHLDQQLATVRQRHGRILLGSGEGARAATRWLFKHPELFARAIAVNPGMQWEYQNSQQSADSGLNKDNSWQLAFDYALSQSPLKVKLLLLADQQSPNWPSTTAYANFLEQLAIAHKLESYQRDAKISLEKRVTGKGVLWLAPEIAEIPR
ncbi:hypothetical protein [Agaribacterium haliotis]|uniref:hypothetical protein n=1 Tax=Agaribacterium haliotis TaxID=2013869 RepID=UPI000BB53D5D|nr:hypothetical protein [Agaribacterium haliotis]